MKDLARVFAERYGTTVIVEDGFRWPTTGKPQFIGPDNRLYSIAGDPFPQVRRYQVTVR